MVGEEKKIIQFGSGIQFQPMHEKYGRAEFQLCPVFNAGVIKKFLIYPRQQETKLCYEVDLSNSNSRRISKLWFSSYQGLPEALVWYSQWCKDHKCFELELYVPPDSRRLQIEFCFRDTIHLEFWRG